jgi:hypothetical protein
MICHIFQEHVRGRRVSWTDRDELFDVQEIRRKRRFPLLPEAMSSRLLQEDLCGT